MKKIFILFLLIPFLSNAQTFFTTFGGAENDAGHFIQEDTLGNIIVAGDSGRFHTGISYGNMLLFKMNANGNLLWSKTYGDSGIQIARCVRQTLDGGYILHGDRTGSESLLLKTNGNGDCLWSTFDLGGMGSRWGISVITLQDSSFIIGSINNDIQAYNPYQLFRVDKIGQPLWTHYVDVVSSTYFDGLGSSLVEGNDHNFVSVAIEELNFQSQDVIGISKVDINGNILWNKIYSSTLNCEGVSLASCSDSGFVIAGYSNSFSAGDYDMLIMKINKDGDSLWSKTFGGSGNDNLTAIQQTSDGGYIAFGNSDSYGNGIDAIVLKLNAQGDSVWQKSFGGPNDEIVMHGIICHDGGFALTGSTKSYGVGNEDVFILKTDSSGNIINGVFEKDVNTTNIYPNPFNDKLNFKTIKPLSYLSIYDLMGKVVYEFSGSTNDLTLNTNKWSSGVYICRMLFSDGSSETLKVVKGE